MRCGTSQNVAVSNDADNTFSCQRCGNKVTQFVNAHAGTINTDGTVFATLIEMLDQQLIERDVVRLGHLLQVVNSNGDPLTVHCTIGDAGLPPLFVDRKPPLLPPVSGKSSPRSAWQHRLYVDVPVGVLPRRYEPVGVDLSVTDAQGQQLGRSQGGINAIRVFMEIINLEFDRLRRERRRLSLDMEKLQIRYEQLELEYQGLQLEAEALNLAREWLLLPEPARPQLGAGVRQPKWDQLNAAFERLHADQQAHARLLVPVVTQLVSHLLPE